MRAQGILYTHASLKQDEALGGMLNQGGKHDKLAPLICRIGIALCGGIASNAEPSFVDFEIAQIEKLKEAIGSINQSYVTWG